MATARRTGPPDLDFDGPPGSAPALPERWGESRTDYLRLVVNPLLALAAVVVLLGLALASARLGFRPPVAVALACLAFTPRLVQFHCLDCGMTGRYRLWGRHLCRAVLERGWAGRRPRLRLPSPPLQLAIWWYVIGMVILIAAIAWSRR